MNREPACPTGQNLLVLPEDSGLQDVLASRAGENARTALFARDAVSALRIVPVHSQTPGRLVEIGDCSADGIGSELARKLFAESLEGLDLVGPVVHEFAGSPPHRSGFLLVRCRNLRR